MMCWTAQCHRLPASEMTEGSFAQALCIEDSLAAGQCNPLYDDAVLRAKASPWACPPQASVLVNPAALHDRNALDMGRAPQEAANIGQVQHEGACSLSAGNASSLCTMLTADVAANEGPYLSADGAVMGAHASPCCDTTQLEALVADAFAAIRAPVCDMRVSLRQ